LERNQSDAATRRNTKRFFVAKVSSFVLHAEEILPQSHFSIAGWSCNNARERVLESLIHLS